MIFGFPIIDFFFLPIIFFIGIITSYEDFKTGKIRNKWILFGFFYWLALFCAFFVWNLSFDGIFDYSYLFSVVINGFVTLIFVFVLWEFGIIGAGDAKLFWLYSLLVPFSYYWKTYLPFFPSIVLYVNTFIIILVYLLAMAVFSYLKDNKGQYKKSFTNKIIYLQKKHQEGGSSYRTIGVSVMGFLAAIIAINSIAAYYSIEIKNLPAYIIVILFFFRRLLSGFFARKDAMIYIGLYLSLFLFYGLLTDTKATIIMFLSLVKNLGILIIFLTSINSLIRRYILKTSTKVVKAENLEKTMVIDRSFVKILRNDKRYYQEKIGRIYSGALSNKQVVAIKNWCKRNKIEKISIFKPFHLAIWIFLGVIATLIYKGSLIKLFMN